MLTAALALSAGYTPRGPMPSTVRNVPMRAASPALNLQQRAQSAFVGAALAATVAVQGASAADPWPYSTLLQKVKGDEVSKVAFSDDGTKVVAFDQEGRDHQVNVFPGGDAELVSELRIHNVQFAVVPPPEANPAVQLLGGLGSLFINFLPLFLLVGLNILASRGGMGGGGNDEREQTLNQILTEMDGFEGNSGVIVLAATNRVDILDPALIRPGRFDRRVPVDLPDVKGRLDILKVHVRGKPLAADVDLNIIAKRTTGFSGASLANLMNEAAIVAARNGRTDIGYEQIDYAIDRVTVGLQKTTGTTFPARQKLVAYHEAGHAVAGLLTPDYDMVTKVTIIPRTNGAGGFTLFTPSEERLESGMYSFKYLKAQLCVALGGRVAEEIIYGNDEVTTGASNDLQQVRNIARRMVAQWGFANDMMGDAPVAWEVPDGNGLSQQRVASMKTETAMDEQIQRIVEDAYNTCYKLLTENRALLDELTEKLIVDETVDYETLNSMRDAHYAKMPAAAA